MKRVCKSFLTVLLAVCIVTSLLPAAAAIEMKTGIGIVETNGLRLRAKPDTNAEILDNASYGDNVVIIRKVDNWYLVDYNLQVGYMSADYITVKDRENVELGNGVVEEGTVNLRSKPSPDGDMLAQLTAGEKAYIIGFNCGWYKVQYSGLTGYIRSDLLALTEAPKTNSNGANYVSIGQQIVDYSYNFKGVPYVWGGTTTKGFDCSGFTQYVFKQMGYTIKRTAAEQLTNGTAVTDLQVGDLVFFNRTYAGNLPATHVGIYIGDNQFIHAGGSCVQITDLSDPFYASRYVGARRIV